MHPERANNPVKGETPMNRERRHPPAPPELVAGSGRGALERTDRTVPTASRRGDHSWSRTLLAPFALVGLAAVLVASAVPASAGAEPRTATVEPAKVAALVPAGFRCVVAKRKAAVRKLRAIDACYGKPSSLNPQSPDPTCLTNAELRFHREFQRIEASGDCVPQTGDEPAVSNVVDQCEGKLLQALPGMCLEAGSPCGTGTSCCAGLVCLGAIGQPPSCR
jgi:hypothetical protein